MTASSALSPMLSDQEIAQVRLPLERASLLPPRVYSNDTIYELEKRRLFTRSWLPVCHVSQLPTTGSYVTRVLADEPVIAVRDKDKKVNVMSNVCRHRASILLDGHGQCEANRLICRYHSWTYRLDGQLIGAPHMDQVDGFDKSTIRLQHFNSEIWHGFVFVNLDSQAPPMNAQLSTLGDKIAPYQFDKMTAVEVIRRSLPWNWKVSLENFSESYHQIAVHTKTVQPYNPASLVQYHESDGPYCIFFSPQKPDITPPPPLVPVIENMPQSYYKGTNIFDVFPYFHVLAESSFALWFDLEVRSEHQTDAVWYMLVPSDKLNDQNMTALTEEFRHIFGPVLDEDYAACHGVGVGSRSRVAQPGRLSHMERSIHQFQNWWLDKMLTSESL